MYYTQWCPDRAGKFGDSTKGNIFGDRFDRLYAQSAHCLNNSLTIPTTSEEKPGDDTSTVKRSARGHQARATNRAHLAAPGASHTRATFQPLPQ